MPLQPDINLKLDKLRIQQVMINLLSNAIKFSKAHDEITVTICTKALEVPRNLEVFIEVLDTGVGISS